MVIERLSEGVYTLRAPHQPTTTQREAIDYVTRCKSFRTKENGAHKKANFYTTATAAEGSE